MVSWKEPNAINQWPSESILHFIIKAMVAKAVYESHKKEKKVKVLETEIMIGNKIIDVFDLITHYAYEIETNLTEKKRQNKREATIFHRIEEVRIIDTKKLDPELISAIEKLYKEIKEKVECLP